MKHLLVVIVMLLAAVPVMALANPTVTGLSPNFGPAAGGTSVTITGTGFNQGVAQVTFGNYVAPSFTVNSDTQITATSPAGSGKGNVRVTTTSGGKSPYTTANTWYYAPVVQDAGPRRGEAGDDIRIEGKGFFEPVTAMAAGVQLDNIIVETAGVITATVPQCSGTGPITVTSPYGTSVVNPTITWSCDPARITSLTPNHGIPGDTVLVTGRHLQTVYRMSMYDSLGTCEIPTYTIDSDTEITMTMPDCGRTPGDSMYINAWNPSGRNNPPGNQASFLWD